MSTFLTVAFSDDPTRSAHVEMAFGRGGPDADIPWARVDVFSGGAADPEVWTRVTRDAARLASAVFSKQEVTAVAFAGTDILPVEAPVLWGTALGARHEASEDDWRLRVSRKASPPPANSAPVASALLGDFRMWSSGSENTAASGRGDASVEEVFAKVAEYARQFGSHPDFRSRDMRVIMKINNYITSVYGAPLPAATLEGVRARLAALRDRR